MSDQNALTALTAPCGLDCFNCDIYEKNLTSELAQWIHTNRGVALDEIPCKGCRQQDGQHYHLAGQGCATLDCVKEKGVNLCCDCQEFPCQLLAPIADKADIFPHNIKVYNLCRIKQVGLTHWIEQEAGEIRQKYFKSPFLVGRGHVD